MRSLLSRLSPRSSAPAAGGGLELWINVDDITAIWSRLPGLDPERPEGERIWLLTPQIAALLGAHLEEPAKRVAAAIAPDVRQLGGEWARLAPEATAWPGVAEVLVAGLGLGCAVPRLVSWRGPGAFAVDFGDAAWSGEQPPGPPLLRLSFLAGSGAVGVAVLISRLWRAAQELTLAAKAREWGQVWADYAGPQSSLVSYGNAGLALARAGILRPERVGLQPRLVIIAPVVTARDMAAIEGPWRRFISAAVAAIEQHRGDLVAATGMIRAQSEAVTLHNAAGGTLARDSGAVGDIDLLDAAYFVLADLVYGRLLEAGLGDGGSGTAHSERRRTPPVRAALIEDPGAVWQWLTASH